VCKLCVAKQILCDLYSFGRGALYHLLRNRIYRGEVVHKGIAYPGEHEPIVNEELWNTVQASRPIQSD
jgi:hypothetical protein